MIEIDHLSKTYGARTIIDNLCLHLPEGGIISLIGPNGSGKSTLLMMIRRLLPITKGTINVDGFDIQTMSHDVLAKKLSLLRQDNPLSVRLTVRDLVSFGRYPYSKGRYNNEDRQFINSAIQYLGLKDLEMRFLDELSGGQRQRAFIAMVICQDTNYCLLDEPLNNLDMKHSVSMMQKLRRTANELKKTILLVMHDINFASYYSDLIVAIKNGKAAYCGSPKEIIQPEILKDIYDMDIQVTTINDVPIALYYR
ncbi:ATPase component of iron transport system [Bartonella clarridgeiae 73]|uniref:ATPase component of iron transport system n=1 Tax=Bartonella clarridgeiae (strain CCUG 45776 / CIP 104772 / 73) TaxID=696125 RepID=E6YH35_BARC7|nr:ATP-binding cassette domain-containing protein [Bartonella clarridgeiae]WCR55245.1 MAG: Iron compound ABC transporter ATP-binding protein [Bartonella clarridgeiae]CBI76173.1 ATPase component of iron transport system [Bartonella clarridgeiae 73]